MIGGRIKELASDKELTLKELSSSIDVSYRTVQNYIAEISSLNGDFLANVFEKIGANPSWLLLGIGPKYVTGDHQNWHKEGALSPDFIPIQRFDVSASAGHGSLVGVEEGTGHYAFNRKWLERRNLKPENLSVISVRGDSMEPTLSDSDLILIDRSQQRPRDGDIYVIRYSGDLFVKHVQVMPENRIELVSANPLYKSIAIDIPQDGAPHDADLAFIGRVVASMHEW